MTIVARRLNGPASLVYGVIIALASVFGAGEASAATRVAVVDAEKKTWQQQVALYGSLTSPRDADVTARVDGLVESVDVSAGDRVQQGDTLITLDRALDDHTLDTLIAEREAATARLTEARRLGAEARRLARENAVAQTELAARRAEIEAQAATVEQLAARIARQREVVERHAVIAPFDGIVRARQVEPGEYVQASTPVVGLVATDRLRVDIAAPQQYFGLIEPGTSMTIEPEASARDSQTARVDVVVPAADENARSFLVRAYIDNTETQLTPGMSVRAIFSLVSRQTVVQVPRDALVRVPGGGVRVWTVIRGEDNQLRAIKRQVTLGRSAGGVVEIQNGLSAGQPVIVRGNEGLSESQAVEIVDKPSTTAAHDSGRSVVGLLPEARAGPVLEVSRALGLVRES